MYNHAPPDYDCPFCRIAKGDYTDTRPLTRPEDVFLKTELATLEERLPYAQKLRDYFAQVPV